MLLVDDILILLALLAAFGVAAELVGKGTGKFEGLAGQGLAGGVIFGLLGSIPETIFVVVAVLSGSYDVAIGTALGGNVILFTLGIGIIGVGYFLKWRKEIVMKEDYHLDLRFLMLATVAMLVILLYGKLNAIGGAFLFLIYAVYITLRLARGHSKMAIHLRSDAGRVELIRGVIYIALGTGIIIVISNLFISTIVNMAGLLGIAAVWLALVITPIASDLIEQWSAYRITQRSQGGGSTAIVGFIGGKLENNTVLLGIIGLFAAGPVALASVAPEFIAVILINTIAIAIFSRGKFTYGQGLAMILLYFVTIAAAFIV